ncbi:MAG: cytochrome c [Rhodocyclaceae bacterium]|nr:cytochrome c [Rhodocyclaceae bacterium]
MRFLVLMSLLAVATSASAAGDPKAGKLLHDERCVSCHVEKFGGDGSKIYTRSPRLINNKTALAQRVAMCAAMTGAKWFPEEEADVVAYLNQQFYKFK